MLSCEPPNVLAGVLMRRPRPGLATFLDSPWNAISRGLLLLRLEGLLAIAAYHDDGEEAADDGGAENDEDDRDADGPDAWQEEGVEEVVVVDEWLGMLVCDQGRVCTVRETSD